MQQLQLFFEQSLKLKHDMIKITLKDATGPEKELTKNIADCDFCGEVEKPCIRGRKIQLGYEMESARVIEGKPRQTLTGKYKIDDYHFKHVADYDHPIHNHVDICEDCVNQLAKLIK